MKYRKKPIVIEAWLNVHNPQCPFPKWLANAQEEGVVWRRFGEMEFYINTLEGVMTANESDWIIKGIKGEIYPCKPDVFELTYEPVK